MARIADASLERRGIVAPQQYLTNCALAAPFRVSMPHETGKASCSASLPPRARMLVCKTENGLSDHKFKIGQIVSYTSGPYGRATGLFKITQLLPPEGDDMQYRIKSDTEPHERVVKESQLSGAT